MRTEAFECEGKGIADWLLESVGCDAARRAKAAEVLLELQLGFSVYAEPNPDAEVGGDEHDARFRAELERVLFDPGFPGPEVVEGIIAIMKGTHVEWLRLFNDDRRRTDRVVDRVAKQIESVTEKTRDKAVNRLVAVCCATTRQEAAAERSLMHNASINCLFVSLGRGLLLAPKSIRRLLKHKTHRWAALDAIKRAGPVVADAFLDAILPADGPDMSHDAVAALAAMGRCDPRVVSRVFTRLQLALDKTLPSEPAPSIESPEFHRYYHWYYSVWDPCTVLHLIGPLARTVPDVGSRIVPLLLRLT